MILHPEKKIIRRLGFEAHPRCPGSFASWALVKTCLGKGLPGFMERFFCSRPSQPKQRAHSSVALVPGAI